MKGDELDFVLQEVETLSMKNCEALEYDKILFLHQNCTFRHKKALLLQPPPTFANLCVLTSEPEHDGWH